MATTVVIIGAGLTGLMCAIHLAERGFKVLVFDKRQLGDIFTTKYKSLGLPARSMSMDISSRGIFALKSVGLFDKIKSCSVPMKYKIIHDHLNRQTMLSYGQLENECILAVSRTYLFQSLLEKCQTMPNIDINFNFRLFDIDVSEKIAWIENSTLRTKKVIKPDVIIGADGSNSTTRQILQKKYDRFFVISDFPMSYKELSIPNHAHQFRIDAAHVWPRIDMMLVAQPNLDASFTCTFLMHENNKKYCFANVDTASKIRDLFALQFSDALAAMPNLESEYITNPISKMKIVAGPVWTGDDFVLLLGDAAHGMAPFFGQGVNCCFEDCTFLAQQLDETNNDWPEVFKRFNKTRVPEANAINTLSYNNYPELFAKNNLHKLQLMKELEAFLAAQYSDIYRTYHNLVCFDRVSYIVAEKIKKLQIPLLERLSANINDINALDHDLVEKEMLAYQKDLALLAKD